MRRGGWPHLQRSEEGFLRDHVQLTMELPAETAFDMVIHVQDML
jgi:hypothetical protein